MYYWIALCGLIVIFVVGLYMNKIDSYGNGEFFACLSGVFLFVFILSTIIGQVSSTLSIVKIESKRESISKAKEAGNLLENATLTIEIMNINAKIAKLKTLNTYFDGFVCDEIEKVKPIDF